MGTAWVRWLYGVEFGTVLNCWRVGGGRSICVVSTQQPVGFHLCVCLTTVTCLIVSFCVVAFSFSRQNDTLRGEERLTSRWIFFFVFSHVSKSLHPVVSPLTSSLSLSLCVSESFGVKPSPSLFLSFGVWLHSVRKIDRLGTVFLVCRRQTTTTTAVGGHDEYATTTATTSTTTAGHIPVVRVWVYPYQQCHWKGQCMETPGLF